MSACNCKADIEAKLLERFKETTPTGTGHDAKLIGYAFGIVGNKMVLRPSTTYETSSVQPLKNGGTRLRKSRGIMVFSFCPYCGVSLKEGGA